MAQSNRSGRTQVGEEDKGQEMLAVSLVATLGLESAIHVCHANAWHGVLSYVTSAVTPGPAGGEAMAG